MFTIILKVTAEGTQAKILRQDFRSSKYGETVRVLRTPDFEVLSSDYPDLRWNCLWGRGSLIGRDNEILVNRRYDGEIKRVFHKILIHDNELIRERLSL